MKWKINTTTINRTFDTYDEAINFIYNVGTYLFKHLEEVRT